MSERNLPQTHWHKLINGEESSVRCDFCRTEERGSRKLTKSFTHHMISMARVIWLVLILFSTFAAGLFTVEVDKDSYNSEFRAEVVMGCSFQPPSPAALSSIRVTWHWLAPGGHVREVHRYDNGEEQITSQHPDYVGRARLLKEELKRGWAKLQVSNLKISDSGKYQCFVQTGDGADYKIMTLSIFAPFKTIDRRIEKVPGREEVMLTCQSEGFPQPEVMWHNNGQRLKSKPITTTATTEDQLLQITTQINVTSLEKNNYTCSFTDHAATFDIPDDIPAPAEKNNAIIVAWSLAVTLALVILIIVVCKCRHKVLRSVSTRNLLADALGRGLTLATETTQETINEEEKTKMNATINSSDLKTLLRGHYLKWGNHSDVEEPCPTLYNNDGQELHLHDLVPKREALLLIGSTGDGKTTPARRLVSLWTRQPVSNFPDLSHLQLVVYVDGNKTNGTLFDEIMAQLSLEEVLSEDDLRTMLTDETLLIVDGYEEGNLLFDESLQRFLSDRTQCRVLITSSPEHCKIKEIVGTEAIVLNQQSSAA